MSYITSIGTANPSHRFPQQTIANFMVRAMNLNADDARKLLVLYRATGIDTRYSVLGDYGRENHFDFFPDNELLEPFPSTKHASLVRSNVCAPNLAGFIWAQIET